MVQSVVGDEDMHKALRPISALTEEGVLILKKLKLKK